MIARLTGKLVERDGSVGIFDVHGVGYEVFSTVDALEGWMRADDEIIAYISTQVREDAITLYAFPAIVDKQAFTKLIAVSGIGPKLALAALDTLDIDTLSTAIEADDIRKLTSIPGVGKKTAQRMALELKGKLPSRFSPSTATDSPSSPPPQSDTLVAALDRLGYKRAEIEKVRRQLVEQGIPDNAPIATRLRAALQILYGNAS